MTNHDWLISMESNKISQQKRYCRQVLPKVSRTFALNIGLLKGDLYWSVLISYLACRILDTVEDSPSISSGKNNPS